MKLRRILEIEGSIAFPKPDEVVFDWGQFPTSNPKKDLIEEVMGEEMLVVKFLGVDYFKGVESGKWYKIIKTVI